MGRATRRSADRALTSSVVEVTRGRTGGDAQTIAGYVPLPCEPGGLDLVEALASAHPSSRLILPILLPSQDLDWAEYKGPDSLQPAALGLLEPSGTPLGPEVIAMASFIVAPAVAVDSRGVRLGRGGGSYDRALARVATDVDIITLLYEGELIERLPRQPHDRSVTTAIVANGASTNVTRFTSDQSPSL